MSVIFQMNASGLYPWSADLEGSIDVRTEERAGFAMLLGWLDKFLCANGLEPNRAACERFWSRKRLRLTRLVYSEGSR
jgi:hypothetical protein